MSETVTEVLKLAHNHQNGPATGEVASATFSEYWFRTSGLCEIAERLGWSRSNVAKHARLLNEIVPGVLDLARQHQDGRGTRDVPTGTFSERWFRTSGLYEIGERLGWSRDKVAKHSQLVNEIVTDVLVLARGHQSGRVTDDVTNVTFTEYWFRTSGLYDPDRIVSHLHRCLYIRSSQPVFRRLGVSQLVKKKGVFVR